MDLRLLFTKMVSLDSTLHNYTVSLCMWCVCGFITRIFLAVLATLEDISIEESSIMQGDSTTFTCNFVKGNNDVSVIWEVNNERYACPPEEGGEEGYECTIDDSQSAFQLLCINSFDVGTYSVQCTLEERIPDIFHENDPSSNELNIKMSNIETLNITAKQPPPSVSSES